MSERGILQGRLDPGLSDDGIADAERAAEFLAAAGVERIASSPLVRARQTADVLGRRLGARVAVRDALVDVDLGRWAGRTMEDLAREEPDAFRSYFRFPIAVQFPSGESMIAVDRRVLRGLRQIVLADRGRVVAVVTHELLVRRVLVRAKRLEGTAMWDPILPPGAVTELRATGEGFEVPTVLEELFRSATRGSRRGAR